MNNYREPKKVSTLEEYKKEDVVKENEEVEEELEEKEVKDEEVKESAEQEVEKEDLEEDVELIKGYSLAVYKSPNVIQDYKRLECESFEEIIESWLDEFMENPARVSITAEESQAEDLVEWAKENKEFVLEKIEDYGADDYINTEVFMARLDESKVYGFTAGAPQEVSPFSTG